MTEQGVTERVDNRRVRISSGDGLRPWGIAAILIGIFSSTYVFSSMNVALPQLAAELGADPGQLKLIMGGYATALAVFVIPAGRLGDRYGRRRLVIIGYAATLLVAILAGLAPGPWTLIGLRILLGATVALYLPQLLSIIQVSTNGVARVRLVSAYAGAGGLGTAAGQVLGGALLQANLLGTSWRPLLWVLGLLGAIALFGAITLPSSRSPQAAANDHPGTIALGLLIACFLVPVSLGPTAGWPIWMIIALIAVLPLGAMFWRLERRLERRGGVPLVPPSVLAEPAVARGLVIALLFFGAFSAFMYEYALISQGQWRASPMRSGLSLVPFALAFVVGSLVVGRVRIWLGSNPNVMIVGTIAQIVALLALIVLIGGSAAEPSPWLLQPLLVLLGLAQAWQYGPLVATVMDGVPLAVAGLTGGLFATAQQAALGLGVAVYGALLTGLQTAGLTPAQAMAGCLAVNVVSALVVLGIVRSLRRVAPA